MVTSAAKTVDEYLSKLDTGRRDAIETVRRQVIESLPEGYEEVMQHGMICWVVPLERFPKTYNGRPMMYAALASQKNYMSLHLMSVYGNEAIERWFTERYEASGKKLDMGKSCVRFKKLDDLPLDLVGEAIAKTSVSAFIDIYNAARSQTRSG